MGDAHSGYRGQVASGAFASMLTGLSGRPHVYLHLCRKSQTPGAAGFSDMPHRLPPEAVKQQISFGFAASRALCGASDRFSALVLACWEPFRPHTNTHEGHTDAGFLLFNFLLNANIQSPRATDGFPRNPGRWGRFTE